MQFFTKKMRRLKNLKPVLFICLFSSVVFIFQHLPAEEKKLREKFFELSNGLKVFLLERDHLPLVNMVFAVNAGSKDETAETSGLAHLLEHLILFRGEAVDDGADIRLEARRRGAYVNAHTGQDLSLFEIALPAEQADFGLAFLQEILFDFRLSREELAKEKEVVLEELSRVEDDPLRYAVSLVFQNLFPGHAYGNPVLGTREVIKSLSLDQVEAFHKNHFVPSNCSMAVVGDFVLEEMEEKIRSRFGVLDRIPPPSGRAFKAAQLGKPVEIEKELDVQKAHLVIGYVAPDYNHADQYDMDVLTEIFGRGVNPLLHTILRGRRRLAETVSMNYAAMKYGGAVLIHLTLDPKNVPSARREVTEFLKKARQENYSSEDYSGEEGFYAFDYLESAKNQILFNLHQAQEKGLSLAGSLAKHMLLNERPASGPFWENIKKVGSSDLRKTAGRYFSGAGYAAVSVLPRQEAKKR